MHIIYTRHASQRITQRNVSHEQIVETLTAPDDIRFGSKGETIAVKSFGVWEVQVIYEEQEEETLLVLTVIRSRL